MCRTNAGTAMGNAMRRFWIPVIQSSGMPAPNGEPKTIELLGERFVVWRDQQGRPGLYAEGCLHRGASMQLARAEGDGLRCIYHGWKFAVDGTVLETPNVEDPRFKQRIKGRTYLVREAGGILWGYLGPQGEEPPLPHWAFMDQPELHRINACAVVNANYVQVMEGLVDSSHLTVLHSSALARTNDSDLDYAKKTSHMQFDAAPRIEADETDFGFHYVAIRQTDGKRIARVTSFIAPCDRACQRRALQPLSRLVGCRKAHWRGTFAQRAAYICWVGRPNASQIRNDGRHLRLPLSDVCRERLSPGPASAAKRSLHRLRQHHARGRGLQRIERRNPRPLAGAAVNSGHRYQSPSTLPAHLRPSRPRPEGDSRTASGRRQCDRCVR
jgi:phenylpropionate dioxygenase-like ring-hydroxylating dioxygenase large terminal subunit